MAKKSKEKDKQENAKDDVLVIKHPATLHDVGVAASGIVKVKIKIPASEMAQAVKYLLLNGGNMKIGMGAHGTNKIKSMGIFIYKTIKFDADCEATLEIHSDTELSKPDRILKMLKQPIYVFAKRPEDEDGDDE